MRTPCSSDATLCYCRDWRGGAARGAEGEYRFLRLTARESSGGQPHLRSSPCTQQHLSACGPRPAPSVRPMTLLSSDTSQAVLCQALVEGMSDAVLLLDPALMQF